MAQATTPATIGLPGILLMSAHRGASARSAGRTEPSSHSDTLSGAPPVFTSGFATYSFSLTSPWLLSPTHLPWVVLRKQVPPPQRFQQSPHGESPSSRPSLKSLKFHYYHPTQPRGYITASPGLGPPSDWPLKTWVHSSSMAACHPIPLCNLMARYPQMQRFCPSQSLAGMTAQ